MKCLMVDDYFGKIIYWLMFEYFWLSVSCYSLFKGDFRGNFERFFLLFIVLYRWKKL